MVTSYTVTKRVLRYWSTRFGKIISCRLCDKQFEEGDEVVSKADTRMEKVDSKHYHTECINMGSTRRGVTT